MLLTRRRLLGMLPAVATLPRGIFSHAAVPRTYMLVGTGTQGKSTSKGIYAAEWNAAKRELEAFSLVVEQQNPTFLALRPGQRNVYAICEAKDGAVYAYAVHRTPGEAPRLDLLGTQSTDGAGPAHVSVSPDGRSVFASNYGGGSFASYKVENSGALSAAVSYIAYAPVDGLAIHSHPHAHEATPSPDGKWLLVNDLGSDRIWIYKIDPATARLTAGSQPFWQGRIGSGPRHLVFHPNGKWVYNVNELDSTVDPLLWNSNSGTLITLAPPVSTLPVDYPPGTAFASEIIVSPDGRFLYVGNRRHESIARLDIDPASGAVKLAQLLMHGGKTARYITLDPSGRSLLVACQDSGEVVVLARDVTSGELSGPLHTYSLDSPQCLIFTT